MSDRPMNTVEKILARASGRAFVSPGDLVVVDVDRAVLTESQLAPNGLAWREPTQVAHPERVAIVADHAVPAPTVRDADAMRYARTFADHFGVKMFDVGAGGGISHEVMAENRLARPGEILLCGDSHTCASGAFNCAARGVGGLEMVSILATGQTWFVVAPTIRVELTGALPAGCDGKDVFLALAQRYGSAENHNLEFAGDAIAGMSLHTRRIIATQGIEIGAGFVLFPCDELTRSHFDELVVGVEPDEDAEYAAVWQLDLAALVPKIAEPGGIVGRVKDASEAVGVRVDQCFVGSCANGHLEDFRVVASIVAGRKVAAGTRLIVTPASQAIYAAAVREGYVATILEAGGIVTPSTCGACYGYHMGVLGDGETCITASTRNFKGRMGSPNAEVYLASTRTVAESALAGRVAVPKEFSHADQR